MVRHVTAEGVEEEEPGLLSVTCWSAWPFSRVGVRKECDPSQTRVQRLWGVDRLSPSAPVPAGRARNHSSLNTPDAPAQEGAVHSLCLCDLVLHAGPTATGTFHSCLTRKVNANLQQAKCDEMKQSSKLPKLSSL